MGERIEAFFSGPAQGQIDHLISALEGLGTALCFIAAAIVLLAIIHAARGYR